MSGPPRPVPPGGGRKESPPPRPTGKAAAKPEVKPAPLSAAAAASARAAVEAGSGAVPPVPRPTPPGFPAPTVEDILAQMERPLAEKHQEYIRRAYELARKAHEGQLRKSGEPYFVHCAEVAKLIARLVPDWPSIAAGLLHDTIEDCGVTAEELRAQFPDPVADLVDGVSKISSITFASEGESQAGNLRKMILAMAKDVRVVLIKLCDRLHNMRTLQHLRPERQKFIATQTIEIYAPLAKRLGMERISRELEDLCLCYLQPALYKRLSEHLERNRARYEVVIERTKTTLGDNLERAHIPARVRGRVKHIYSIYRKMLKQGLDLDEVHDLIAIRIVTQTVAQTYEALGIAHSRWRPAPGRFKDYIASPKPNGYQSLHTTVVGPEGDLIEIQIRTEDMHKSADEGIAAHWQYKEAGSNVAAQLAEAKRLAWLRQLVDWLTDIQDPQEFMTAIKKDVFEASVFCYTPRGDIIEMPKGSTILDFAYRIHSDLGTHCAGGKVNHKLVSLRTTLNTGDIIEIMQAKSSHPTPDWLQIASSGRAKNKIRHWLKSHGKEDYLQRGRESLMAHLETRGIEVTQEELNQKLEIVAKQMTLPHAEDVLIEIGFGTQKPGAIWSRIQPEAPPPRRRASKRERKQTGETVLVEGLSGAVTRLAKCCAPKPGDPIVGFVTQGRGISVHHSQCRAFQRILDTHADAYSRMVGVLWSDGAARMITASIRVVCQDRKGLLTDITQAVTRLGANIIEARTKSNFRTHQAILKLTVQVPDDAALNTLLNRLETVPSVRAVSRSVHDQD